MQLLSRLLGRHSHERTTQNAQASNHAMDVGPVLETHASPTPPAPAAGTKISLPMRLMSPSVLRNRRKKGQNPARRRSTAVTALDDPLEAIRSFDAALESFMNEHFPKDGHRFADTPAIVIFPPPVPVLAYAPQIPNLALLVPPSESELRHRRRKGQNPARRSAVVSSPLPSIETVLLTEKKEQGASDALQPQTSAVHSEPTDKEKCLPPLPTPDVDATQGGVLQRRKAKRLTNSSSNRIANSCVFCEVGLSHQACLINVLEWLPPPPPRSGPLVRPFLARKPVPREVVANALAPASAARRSSFYTFPAVCTAVLALVLLTRN
ncbi:hypothetical protein FB45DRAFT_894638 [Roridomyces roridus]|uniref:Uncharacterized protein n=1 Tax=Roridomyces roridus TaxID=1738132 RepID=A0AAD7CGQ2_9AGAR|nr:hypothetical protein FB45DRAFT_894638 [Roridomyces roridus]